MEAIFKYENTYIVVDNKNVRDGVDLQSCKELIIDDKYKISNSLYGGRVVIHKKGYGAEGTIAVDGIIIKRFHYNKNTNSSGCGLYVEENFAFSQVAAILNQLENLGIDSFLNNYKKELQNLKVEFEKMSELWQRELSDNDDKNKRCNLEDLKNKLAKMSCIIFSLLINMNAGLDNNHYINAYDAIVGMYF